ncbi:hypothetical protein QYM36_007666, partial [Artemia franciscana]
GSESRRTSLPAKNNAVNYFSLRGCDSSFVKRRHSYYEGKYNNIRHSYLEPAFSSGQDSCMDTNINRGTSLDSRCRMKERKTCKDKDSANLYIDGDTEPLDSSIIDHLQASNDARSCFAPANIIEDSQAIRCAEFHPSGKFYGVGSNSRTLRVFDYPKISELRKNDAVSSPGLVCKKTGHHKGSIYCLGWNPNGDLIATGSNDKTLKLMRFDVENKNFIGDEVDITVHDGTIRDVCFIEDSINKSSLLISGGAGDCKVYITDCTTGKAFQAFGGHTSPILSLYTWGGAMFASGSQDKTVRFWDLRIGGCVSVVTPITSDLSINKGSAVASTCVDPSGRLLVTGHEDGACVFYDIRGARHVQMFKPHASDVRSVRFSPSAYYLLTAGYDGKLVLTDLQ